MARRVRIYKHGGWESLQIEDFETSKLKPDEIKIAVKAAGINFADVCIRQGLYTSANEFVGLPITPGFEVAGKVTGVGSQVKGIKLGERVVAITLFNGYSSEVVIKAGYARKIPTGLTYIEAASIPGVFLTSYYAVYWLSRVRPHSTALVHSVAGGVGLALTQMLKDLDCRVIGVVGTSHKVAIAEQYGANKVIDKSTEDLWSAAEAEAPSGFDLIFDPNGISTLKQSYRHVAPAGLLYVYGFQSMLSKTSGSRLKLLLARDYLRTPRFNPFDMVKMNRSVMAFNVSYLFDFQQLIDDGFSFVMSQFEKGNFRPLPIKTYKFEEVAQAHKDIESGKTTGKLVLTFD